MECKQLQQRVQTQRPVKNITLFLASHTVRLGSQSGLHNHQNKSVAALKKPINVDGFTQTHSIGNALIMKCDLHTWWETRHSRRHYLPTRVVPSNNEYWKASSPRSRLNEEVTLAVNTHAAILWKSMSQFITQPRLPQMNINMRAVQ